MILRMTHGNAHYKVSKILCKIGLMHKIRGEYEDGLNCFSQALDMSTNPKNNAECKFLVVVSHEIGQIFQHKEDA